MLFPPEVLRDLINASMRTLVDEGMMEEIKAREVKDKNRLRMAAARINKE